MKNFTSMVGWLLLVAVLAVPSFLFYNWLSKSKLQNQAELVHEPMAGSVFPSDKSGHPAGGQQASAAPSQQASPVAPPQAVKTGNAGQPGGQAVPAKAPPAPRSADETDGPIEEQPPSASSNPPAAAQQQAPAVSTAAQQGVAVSTGPKLISYYDPKSTRDPTFTPDDYRRIKEERQQREDAERQQLMAERNKPREPGPETRISLQGIVEDTAIINDNMYRVGQTVRGVKILKIGTDYIIAECVAAQCKGKRFKKVLK